MYPSFQSPDCEPHAAHYCGTGAGERTRGEAREKEIGKGEEKEARGGGWRVLRSEMVVSLNRGTQCRPQNTILHMLGLDASESFWHPWQVLASVASNASDQTRKARRGSCTQACCRSLCQSRALSEGSSGRPNTWRVAGT